VGFCGGRFVGEKGQSPLVLSFLPFRYTSTHQPVPSGSCVLAPPSSYQPHFLPLLRMTPLNFSPASTTALSGSLTQSLSSHLQPTSIPLLFCPISPCSIPCCTFLLCAPHKMRPHVFLGLSLSLFLQFGP
jgi:hypothetical protein